MARPNHVQTPVQRMRGLQRQLQNGPVAVESIVAYLPLWYYIPDSLKPRLIYLAGYQSHAAGPGRMSEFSKLGVPVVPYNNFALPGTEFLLYPGKIGRL